MIVLTMTPSLLLSVALLVLAISTGSTGAFTTGPHGKSLSVSSCVALKASKELPFSSGASHNENNAKRSSSDQDHDESHINQRRDLLRLGLAVTPMLLFQNPANAFANKISNKYDDRPKRRGPQVRINPSRNVMLTLSLCLFLSLHSHYPHCHAHSISCTQHVE